MVVTLRPRLNGRAVIEAPHAATSNYKANLKKTAANPNQQSAPPTKIGKDHLRRAHTKRKASAKKPQVTRSARETPRKTQSKTVPTNPVPQPKGVSSRPVPEPKTVAAPQTTIKQKTCYHCTELLADSDPSTKLLGAHCQYNTNVCSKCIGKWIGVQFSTHGAEDIYCSGCNRCMQLEHIKPHVDEETYKRIAKLQDRAKKLRITDYRFCQAPNCEAGQVHKDAHAPFICKSCKFKACVYCGGHWHDGKSCEQNQAEIENKQDAASNQKITATLTKMNIKICPGEKCGARVQKIDGCDHMTCSMCMINFCWTCLRIAETPRHYHIAHDQDCRNAVPRLVVQADDRVIVPRR